MSFGDFECMCIKVEDSETEEGLRAEEATGGRRKWWYSSLAPRNVIGKK